MPTRRRAAPVLGTLTAAVLAGLFGAPPTQAGSTPTCFGDTATIVGTPGPDALRGSRASDIIVGLGGDDAVDGRGGNDLMCGGAGLDTLVGSYGADSLNGGTGDDILNGGFGDDVLVGRDGLDTCLQGPGVGAHRACELFDLQPVFPILATFYYPWYPEGWTQGGISPYTNYHPSLGFYDSADASVIRRHLRAMQYGGFQVGISSWWGHGHPTDQRVGSLLRAAIDTTFRWAIYYEVEGYGDPNVDQIRADLKYIGSNYASDQSFLRIDGRFVVFIYNADDTDCSVVDRWTEANAIGAYLVFKVFAGYQDCPVQPDGWHQYGPDVTEDDQRPFSFTISPGFWLVGEDPRLTRDPLRWTQDISNMLSSGARWQLVATFNEWAEGTAVESAEEWASDSGFGTYLDALHEATATTSSTVRASPAVARTSHPSP